MRTAIALAATLTLITFAAACGGDEDSGPADEPQPAAKTTRDTPSQILRLKAKAAGGKITFDKKKLVAKPGATVIELDNPRRLGHNVRIEKNDGKCCQQPGAKDVGGTETVSEGTIRGAVDLKPGRYSFFCAIGGHWQRGQRGTLLVQ